jgi:hypothetical protein
MQGVNMDVCLVCSRQLSDHRVPTSDVLPKSKSTVGAYLNQHDVISSNAESNECLCDSCFQLVIRCDDLQFEFEEAVRTLKLNLRSCDNDFSIVDVSEVLEQPVGSVTPSFRFVFLPI